MALEHHIKKDGGAKLVQPALLLSAPHFLKLNGKSDTASATKFILIGSRNGLCLSYSADDHLTCANLFGATQTVQPVIVPSYYQREKTRKLAKI